MLARVIGFAMPMIPELTGFSNKLKVRICPTCGARITGDDARDEKDGAGVGGGGKVLGSSGF